MKWKYAQADGERKRFSLDYSDWLDSGELVSTITYGVTPATVPPAVVDNTSTTATGGIFYVSGGLDGSRYQILITMTSSQGQIKEDVLLMHINNP